MGYVESNLISGEQVVHRGKLHWSIYLPGILLLPLYGLGLLFLLVSLLEQATTEMAVTNRRVIMKRGIISRRTLEMNLSKIENIAVDQGLFGRLFNFGTVTVVGTGGTREPFKTVAVPLAFRKAVQAQTPA